MPGLGLLLFASGACLGRAATPVEVAGAGEAEAELAVVSVGFSAFPGYAGDLRVGGALFLRQATAAKVELVYTLFGVDAGCGAAFLGPRDRCAVQIHEGASCAHMASLTAGPVGHQRYFAIGDWALATVNLTAGIRAVALENHTAVITDQSGATVACSPLARFFAVGEEVEVVDWQRYPGYAGDLHVAGGVTIGPMRRALDGRAAQVLALALVSGLDPECGWGAAVAAPEACGIRVHRGEACDAVGGHLWDEAAASGDPWASVRYHPDMPLLLTTPVLTGLELSELRGRAIVVHDAAGARVACALISREVG